MMKAGFRVQEFRVQECLGLEVKDSGLWGRSLI